VDRARYQQILGQRPDRPLPEVRHEEPEAIAPPRAAAGQQATEASSTASPVIRSRVQKFGDHIDTDALIPGEFCHLTDLAELGSHCFHYVAPGFADRVAAGAAVVVAGEAWGSGSSREHAVWALKGAGVKLVIAKSYAFIHRRNLVNEAVPHLVLDDAEFLAAVNDGDAIEADLATGKVTVNGRTFQAEAPAPIATALLSAGGIVEAIRSFGPTVFEQLTA
jgi:aconitate hydratase/homoaconitate hydratase